MRMRRNKTTPQHIQWQNIRVVSCFMKDLYGNDLKDVEIDPTKIILLDLNYTLISNSWTNTGSMADRIPREKYETELLEMIKDNFVILITARPVKYKEETLKNIKRKTGFTPNDSYWNIGMEPPKIKEYWLNEAIFPKYGDDPSQYYGIESNPRTRSMYKKYKIKSDRKEELMAKYQ